jgi:hypothetical protein
MAEGDREGPRPRNLARVTLVVRQRKRVRSMKRDLFSLAALRIPTQPLGHAFMAPSPARVLLSYRSRLVRDLRDALALPLDHLPSEPQYLEPIEDRLGVGRFSTQAQQSWL